MKTLLFKIWQFPHLSETFILNQVITAIHNGFDVKLLVGEVLSFEASKQTKLFKKYNIADKIIIEDYNIPENKIYRFFKWCYLLITNISNLNYIIRFYKHQDSFSLTWLFQLLFYKKFAQASVFHVQYGTNKSPVDVLKKINFIKANLVVSFHGHDAFFPINGFIPNDGYYDCLFDSANAIVANTPYLAKTIKDLGCPSKILKTIPVGVDTSFFYPSAKKEKVSKQFRLISVGRLSPVKGHIYAFKVVEKLINKGYNVLLTVVGEGSERKNLENFIIESKLVQIITLVGAKSQKEVRDLLWNSDLFLFPSVSKHFGKSTETQGLATIEAEACGVPVVVFNSGGVKYTLKNGVTGFICEEFDCDCMFDKIKYLIDNNDLLESMKDNAVSFVRKNYDQKLIDKQWYYLYNS